jgi:hypothetical protein
MPRALAVFISVVALAISLSDCGGSSTSSPTPAPSTSFTPNPSITSTTIQVTWNQSPLPNAPVAESTPASQSSPRPGTPFQTDTTKKDGTVKFGHLNPNKTYCWVATLPRGTSSQCADWTVWQYGSIELGT